MSRVPRCARNARDGEGDAALLLGALWSSHLDE